MTIEILATGIELSSAIRGYVEEKIGSLGKFFKRFERTGPVRARIEVARTSTHHRHGDVFYAEATVPVPGGSTLRVEVSDADLYAAIDHLRDLLKVEATKEKERQVARERANP